METISCDSTVAAMVAHDYRTAAIFEKYGIDFCCRGQLSIDEACEQKHVPTEDVMREIKMLQASGAADGFPYGQWAPALLADHIEEIHHRYIEEKTPVIQRYLDKVCLMHGDHHPELHEINRLFRSAAEALAHHMKKEELILFPRIRVVDRQLREGTPGTLSPGVLSAPIEMMQEEHRTEGDRFATIDSLTGHYQPPADACNTYKLAYALLHEFENDLHLHIHLENNILFPKAVELEKLLLN